jgi:hypothetical protein
MTTGRINQILAPWSRLGGSPRAFPNSLAPHALILLLWPQPFAICTTRVSPSLLQPSLARMICADRPLMSRCPCVAFAFKILPVHQRTSVEPVCLCCGTSLCCLGTRSAHLDYPRAWPGHVSQSMAVAQCHSLLWLVLSLGTTHCFQDRLARKP